MARNKMQFQKGLSEAGVRIGLRDGGEMPRSGDRLTMAEWLRMSGLWWTGALRGKSVWPVSMQRLPPPDLADRGHYLRFDHLHCSAGPTVVTQKRICFPAVNPDISVSEETLLT
jgi:hypothetical protein